MKRALIATAALTLAATSAAWAQEHQDEHGGGHPPAPAHQAPPPGGGHPQGGPAGGFHGAPQGAPQGNPQGGGFHGGPGGAPGQRPTFNQAAPGRQDYQGQHGGNFDQGGQRGQGYNGGYGGQRGGYNGGYGGGYGGQRGGAFSYRGRTFQAFHVGEFRYPGGYGYRRWGIGQRLPRLFLSPSYFINWGAYSLGPPAPGCEWVRYGPDALMVNDYTGQVVDVAYGVFY